MLMFRVGSGKGDDVGALVSAVWAPPFPMFTRPLDQDTSMTRSMAAPSSPRGPSVSQTPGDGIAQFLRRLRLICTETRGGDTARGSEAERGDRARSRGWGCAPCRGVRREKLTTTDAALDCDTM